MNEHDQEKQMVEAVLNTLEGITKISSDTVKIYSDSITALSKERKDLLITLGSISAGAAALAPQFFGHVINSQYFYGGISILSFTAVLSLSYVLGLVEKETG